MNVFIKPSLLLLGASANGEQARLELYVLFDSEYGARAGTGRGGHLGRLMHDDDDVNAHTRRIHCARRVSSVSYIY